MSCEICDDTGLFVIDWTDVGPDEPKDFGLCLCAAGLAMRRAENCGRPTVPLWQVWCAQYQVDPSRIIPMETIYTPAELAAVGLGVAVTTQASREASLLSAARRKSR